MGETYESVTVEIKDQVAQVTLIGPGKGNAMGPAFWSEMPEVFAALDADRDVRAIVLTGSGKNFSYGLDVPAMGGTFTPLLADGALARPRADFHAEVRRMQNAISAVADCRTPDHRVGARLVHRRRSRPDLGGGHPLRQRRRQVLRARGQARHRRRRRQPRPPAADLERRTPARAGA